MKSKTNKMIEVTKRLSLFAFAATLATVTSMIASAAFAADNPNSLAISIATWVIRVLGALPFIPAIINGIQGFTDYQEAKAEGGGPSADKAKQKLVAAITMALVAVVIITAAQSLAKAAVNAFAEQSGFKTITVTNTPTPKPTKTPTP